MWPRMRSRLARVGRFSAVLGVLFALALGSASAAGPQADDALYWRILRDGQERGFLLGTIHSEDPRVLDFPQSLVDQLGSCDRFAMEMVPDLPTLTRLTEYMHYAEPGMLAQQLGAERFERVMKALSGYQVPEDWKTRMKVWAVLMTLSVPPPQSGFFMDLSLSLRAAGGGLEVHGLETLEQQLAFLENMPLNFQLQLLDQALAEYHSVGAIHREMVDLYVSGSLLALAALSAEQFDQLDEPVRRYFVAEGIEERNRRMMESLSALLAESRVFVAAGALHLPGDSGLITLLRAAGYELEPLTNPFAPPAPAQPTEPAAE